MATAISFTVSPYQCEMRFAGWARTNRNNRIARKWRKKYGVRMVCRQTQAYRIGGLLVCCPHQFKAMMAKTKHGGG